MAFERRSLGDGIHALVPGDLEELGVLAAFTERTGGASAPPFASLNLSFAVGDDPARVRRNRRVLARRLGVAAFATAEQVHGARVTRVGKRRSGAGFGGTRGRLPATDALVTSTGGVAMAVLTADCLPVVIAAPGGPVAAVHAGWRGIAAGILERALLEFADRSKVAAAIGPAVGPCHYEVGPEVVAALRGRPTTPAVRRERGGRPRVDLEATAVAALREHGVSRIEAAGICTACESDRFYSHRRDGPGTGRQGVVAVRR